MDGTELDGRIDELRRDLERETQGLRERAAMIESVAGEERSRVDAALDERGDACLSNLGIAVGTGAEGRLELEEAATADRRKIGELELEIAEEKRTRTTADLSLAGEIVELRRGVEVGFEIRPVQDQATLRELGERIQTLGSLLGGELAPRLAALETKHAHRTAELGESVTSLERLVRDQAADIDRAHSLFATLQTELRDLEERTG